MNKKQSNPILKQRITVWIDPDLVCEAKIYALRNKLELGVLVAQALQQVLNNSISTDK